MKIKDFEKITGIKLEDLTTQTFLEIIKNPEYREIFSNRENILSLLTEILNRNKNQDFCREINNIKYMLVFAADEEIIDTLFKRYRNNEISRDKLIETMKTYRQSSDPIFVISVFICSMIALPDVDLSDEINILKENIEKFKAIFDSLGKIESSYQIRSDLIDILYTVRTKVFVEYDIEIDVSWVDSETDKLDTFAMELLEERKMPEINIKPEQLGFIDITKLKKE